jgi:hypothetical protein
MLLSYIKEASPDIYRNAFGKDIPSIARLQHLIEAGWAKGIGYAGCRLMT